MVVLLFVFQALQFLSKAHRSEIQASGWEKEPGLFKEVIIRAINMGEGESTIRPYTQPPSPQRHLNLGVVLFPETCTHDLLIPCDRVSFLP